MKSTCMHYYSFNILFVYYVCPMEGGLDLEIRGVVEEPMVDISLSGAHTYTMKGDGVTKYNQFHCLVFGGQGLYVGNLKVVILCGCNNTPMRYSLIYIPCEQLIRQKPFVACFA